MREQIKLLIERKHSFRKIVVAIWAYLCVLSLGKIISLNGDAYVYWGGDYFGYNITAVIIFGVTIWLFNRFWCCDDKRRKIVSVVGGLLLAAAIVYGAYAHYVNDIFSSLQETLRQLWMILGIMALTVSLISEILVLPDRINALWTTGDEESESGKCKSFEQIKCFFRNHHMVYYLFVWLTIFVCYLPLFLAWWPGNFVFDAKYQMQNVIGGWYSTHHPLIHTLMMGKAYEFGQSVGNVSWGYQFYTLAQMLILTSAFAYMLLYLYKKRVRSCWLMISWAFFALFPMNALFAISATKDVLCAAFFLYFMIFLTRYLFDKENFKPLSYIGMIASGVLLALFRNNALYAVLVTGVILIIFVKGLKRKANILFIFVAVYLLTGIVNNGLISYTNAVDKDSYRETMCVPLQGLARVAAYRTDDLDKSLYNEICQYIREEDIPGYNPYLADGVKNNANEALLRSNTLNFFKLWIKVGLQFPDEYLESIITNTMGYWYPLNQGVYVSADFSLYHTLIGMGDEIEKVNYCDWASDLYASLFWTNDYRSVPILGYSFRNAPYIWLILIFMLWSIYKKYKERLLVGLLPLIYLLTCFCGPMAALRYIYSVVVCVPLIIYLAVFSYGDEK